jgi:hypothetical protein
MIFSLLLKKRIWQSRKEKRAQETELKPQEKAQLLQARAEILRKIERLRQQSKAKSSGKETKAAAPTLNQELLEIEQKLNRL